MLFRSLLIGGSPCQDISKAKVSSEGLKGEKSSLFFEYVRILKEVDPKFFLFENVAGIKKEDLCLVDELLGGNKIKINSSSFSAQNRERYYWSNIELQAPKNTSNLKIKDILINNPNPNLFINLKINRLIKKEGINISPKGLVFIGGITNNKVNK